MRRRGCTRGASGVMAAVETMAAAGSNLAAAEGVHHRQLVQKVLPEPLRTTQRLATLPHPCRRRVNTTVYPTPPLTPAAGTTQRLATLSLSLLPHGAPQKGKGESKAPRHRTVLGPAQAPGAPVGDSRVTVRAEPRCEQMAAAERTLRMFQAPQLVWKDSSRRLSCLSRWPCLSTAPAAPAPRPGASAGRPSRLRRPQP